VVARTVKRSLNYHLSLRTLQLSEIKRVWKGTKIVVLGAFREGPACSKWSKIVVDVSRYTYHFGPLEEVFLYETGALLLPSFMFFLHPKM